MRNIFLVIMMVLSSHTFTYGQLTAINKGIETVVLNGNSSRSLNDNLPTHNSKATNISGLELPAIHPGDVIISHTGYTLSYNETHEQANWVAYKLTKAETIRIVDRTDKFILDPLVLTGTAGAQDYSKSGYDKGHLAPAADMGWSSITMAESFYYSNMSPQMPGFNRGIWKKLEELVRTWAVENKVVYIVTGPVLTKGLQSIGLNKVSVPDYYYKVILDYDEPGIKGIGFIMRNGSLGEPLQNYAVTIDSVEKISGIDFYPLLPDARENVIEKTLCLKCWSWKNIKTENNANHGNKLTTSVQCKGTTKAGARCRKKTLSKSGYCYLHETI
jgi:endonuclease G